MSTLTGNPCDPRHQSNLIEEGLWVPIGRKKNQVPHHTYFVLTPEGRGVIYRPRENEGRASRSKKRGITMSSYGYGKPGGTRCVDNANLYDQNAGDLNYSRALLSLLCYNGIPLIHQVGQLVPLTERYSNFAHLLILKDYTGPESGQNKSSISRRREGAGEGGDNTVSYVQATCC